MKKIKISRLPFNVSRNNSGNLFDECEKITIPELGGEWIVSEYGRSDGGDYYFVDNFGDYHEVDSSTVVSVWYNE
jgi:hypothetical protein